MKRTIAPTTLAVVVHDRVRSGHRCLGLRLVRIENAQTPACRAASDSPAQELFSLSRPLWPALSVRSAGRPSTGKVILTEPRR